METTTTNMFVLYAAESEEQYPYFSLLAVDNSYQQCRRRKRNKVSACLSQRKLLDNLVNTRDSLQALHWQPSSPFCFVVSKPKAREVYAAQFTDRLIHLLVNELTLLLDSQFIYDADAASNRKNKGTYFAVNRLQRFMQQHHGRGYFLQLDIANFFNSISQSILLKLLYKHLSKQNKNKRISEIKAKHLYWLSEKIILQDINGLDCIKIANEAEFNKVPQQLLPAWYLPSVTSFASQWRYFNHQYAGFVVLLQSGYQVVCSFFVGLYSKYLRDFKHPNLVNLNQFSVKNLEQIRALLAQQNKPYIFCSEQSYLKVGLKNVVYD